MFLANQKRTWLVLVMIYVVLVVSSSFAIWQARTWALIELQDGTATDAWEEWRQETNRDTNEEPTPVQRRPLAHREPPTLAMLRDYAFTCWLGLVTLGSVVYWTTTWLLMGAFGRSSPK